MGHTQKRGDKYQARWIDDQGCECAETFARKGDADRRWKAAEAAVLAGAYVNQKNDITVTQSAWQWAATRPHRELTAVRTATLIKTHIEGTPLGSRRLVVVRPSEVGDRALSQAGTVHAAACGEHAQLGLQSRRPRSPGGAQSRRGGQPAARRARASQAADG